MDGSRCCGAETEASILRCTSIPIVAYDPGQVYHNVVTVNHIRR